MNVTQKHLKAFVAISETGSFADAADIIHCSQPALSVTIRNLEGEVGGPLFHRTTRSLTLTPEGIAFLPIAQRLIKDWDDALGDLKNQFSLKRGKLSIAAIPSFASDHLPHALLAFSKRYPGVRLSIQDVITEEVVRMVNTARVEIGITFDPGPIKGLDFYPIFQDRFVALLPQGHELSTKEVVEWEDLQQGDFITLQKPSSVRDLIDNHLDEMGLSLQPACESHQLSTIGRMVAANLGVSIVPSLCARQMEDLGAVCRPLGDPGVIRQIGILTRMRSPLSTASRQMLQLLQHYDWKLS